MPWQQCGTMRFSTIVWHNFQHLPLLHHLKRHSTSPFGPLVFPWPQKKNNFTIWWHNFPCRLLPCFFRATDKKKCRENENRTRQRDLWYRAAGAWPKGWQLKIWSPKSLVAPWSFARREHCNGGFSGYFFGGDGKLSCFFGGIFNKPWNKDPYVI